MKETVATLVLAAGSGTRFGRPKQFMELKPSLRMVDAAVDTASRVSDQVVLVLPDGYTWDGCDVDVAVTGGATRLESVAAGLSEVEADVDIILVHDAAHPLAPERIFNELVDALDKGVDAAVPFLEVPDVIKRRGVDGSLTTVGRDDLGLAQVPMAFRAAALRAVHTNPDSSAREAWEDSMLIELDGGRVVAVPGSTRNVHVVTPEDLAVARQLAGFHASEST